jgi:predicted negative regulator of RcsB-dependent stress response
MGKVKHLSHQQIQKAIKRNEMREAVELSLDWVKGHVESVVIGAVLLAALIFGLVYFQSGRRESAAKASIQLSMADNQFQRVISMGGNPQMLAQVAAAYQAVKTEYASSPEALHAELALANLSFETGKYDEAAQAYAAFTAQHGGSTLAPVALAGQGACLEAQNKPAEAAAAYLSVWKNYPKASNAASALIDAARVYAALGDKAGLKESAAALANLESEGRLPDSLKAKAAAVKGKTA